MRGRLGEGVRWRVTPGSPLYSRLLVNGAGLPPGGAVPAVSAVSAVAGARRQCGTVSRRVQKRPVESAMPAAGDTVATPAVQCSAGQIIYPADPGGHQSSQGISDSHIALLPLFLSILQNCLLDIYCLCDAGALQ